MVTMYLDSIRRHDSIVLAHSKLDVMMSVLYVDHPTNNLPTQNTRPAKAFCDTAYATIGNVIGKMSKAQIAALPPHQQAAAKQADKDTGLFRTSVEDSFQIQTTQWPLADKFRAHSLGRDGKNNFSNLYKLWGIMTLFSNLRCCISGSQINMITKVEPPSVSDYLASTNSGAQQWTAI